MDECKPLACGTPNQYQTPFYDGVFCNDGRGLHSSTSQLNLSRF